MSTVSVAEQMLQPATDCLTPEVAQRIVSARLGAATQARIDELATKANQGALSEEERDEYAQFVEYIDLLGVIKAKARRMLRQADN
ncbi:MAG: hypothetical protein WD030_04975 [Pirellulales bacterium]